MISRQTPDNQHLTTFQTTSVEHLNFNPPFILPKLIKQASEEKKAILNNFILNHKEWKILPP